MIMQGVVLLVALCITAEVSAQRRYPNPRTEPVLCGRSDRSFVCDRDQVLGSNGQEANQLDRLIMQIVNETHCPCSSYSCRHHREGYKIGIALVKNMDVKHSSGGRDDEEESDKRIKNIERKLDLARNHSQEIQKSWKLGRCTEDVLIFYSKDDNVVYTSTGAVARRKLSNDKVSFISTESRRTGFSKSPFLGLMRLVREYGKVFSDNYSRWRKPSN